MAVSHLIKEAGFFSKFGIRPENAFAIYADDDAMAEFIVNGDIVIFNKSKAEPRSGKIFAIENDGALYIRQLWVRNDSSWLLECRNPNKDLYPDQTIPECKISAYKICGEFVYRQGG